MLEENHEKPEHFEPRPKKIPVPTQYREASKILKQVVENGKSLKDLVYNNRHCRQGNMMALLNKIQANEPQIEGMITKSEILIKETMLNPFLARILIAELMFGRKMLNGQSKPVQCVLSYQDKFIEALAEIGENPNQHSKQIQYNVPRYIRLNTILIKKTEAKEYLEREGWRLIENTFETYDEFLEAVRNLDDESYLADYHIKNIYVFSASSRKHWATNEMVYEGKFLLQDKASCLPTFLLDPPHKAQVLDMCSAPGVKTTHLAAIMKNKGKIYAVERDARRYETLCEMVQTTQATIVQPMNNDVLQVKNEDVPNIEYILLDPSCSGSGMLNRFECEINNKDSSRLFKLSGLQHKLLSYAMTEFPNVKKIVYSTCSVYAEENEEVVLGVLRKIGHFKLVNAGELLKNKWNNYGSEAIYPGLGSKVVYAKTSEDLTNGFFVCVLERCEEGEINEFYLQRQQYIETEKKTDKTTETAPKRKRGETEEVEAPEEPTLNEDGSEKKIKKKWKKKNFSQ
ncbi:unnamed protein product [Diamesa hyperborea]